MAGQSGKKAGRKHTNAQSSDASKYEAILWAVLALSIILFISNFGIAGNAGRMISGFVFGMVGLTAYIFPLLLFAAVAFMIANKDNPVATLKIVAAVIFFVFVCMFLELIGGNNLAKSPFDSFVWAKTHRYGGGLIGGILTWLIQPNLGKVSAYIIDIVVMIICMILITERSLWKHIESGSRKVYHTAKEETIRQHEQYTQRRQLRMDNKVVGVSLDTTIKDTGTQAPGSAAVELHADIPVVQDFPIHVMGERSTKKEEQKAQMPKQEAVGMGYHTEIASVIGDAGGKMQRAQALKPDHIIPMESQKVSLQPNFIAEEENIRGAKNQEQIVSPAIQADDLLAKTSDLFSEMLPKFQEPKIDLQKQEDAFKTPYEVALEEETPQEEVSDEKVSDEEVSDKESLYQKSLHQEASKENTLYQEASYEKTLEEDSPYEEALYRETLQEQPPYQGTLYEQTSYEKTLLEDSPYQEIVNNGTSHKESSQEQTFNQEDPYAQTAYLDTSKTDTSTNISDSLALAAGRGEERSYQSTEHPESFEDSAVGETAKSHVIAAQADEWESEDELLQPDDDVFLSAEELMSQQLQESGAKANTQPKQAASKKVTAVAPSVPKKSPAQTASHAADIDVHLQQAQLPVKRKHLFPTSDLLKLGDPNKTGDSRQHLQQTALKLQQTLKNFGVNVTILNVSCGPAVTRYEIQPEMGVKVSKIVNLADDIKLNLAAADIRIEAPIPGKAAIGIEVPNKENVPVMFRSLIEAEEFEHHKSPCAFAVGKDIAGKVVVTDICKMPHLLIAGATGSGKSVCINTIIMSILYKADPQDVKLIMIDPKVVELSVYNGIPHLLLPVVTDPKKAAGALHWAVSEMMERYQKFAGCGVRDIKGYNAKVKKLKDIPDDKKPEKMPYIVIIVDELADLMMVAPGDVEDAICRLAQLARAAGIHLIIATQRPSVNVITGLIKANMPSRIAFSVTSGTDSRTILDMNGAEKLLGKGDMLFYPQGYQKPIRVQGAFVSDPEVTNVVEFLIGQNGAAQHDSALEQKVANAASGSGAIGIDAAPEDDRDVYFADAARLLMEKEKASVSMLQRYFKIGFNRAARIMDQLEEAGVVGAEEGTKPRKILMSPEEFAQYEEEVL